MGLFHKTLQEAEKLMEKKDFDGATKILEKHLKDDLHFRADLQVLTRRCATYQQVLGETIAASKIGQKDSLEHLRYTIRTLRALKMNIAQLIKDEKIILED